MASQREKPGLNVKDYLESIGRDTSKGRYSGTQIENFREGWAMPVFIGKHSPGKAHYFIRDQLKDPESLCGLEYPTSAMFGRGSYEKCKLCMRVIKWKRIEQKN